MESELPLSSQDSIVPVWLEPEGQCPDSEARAPFERRDPRESAGPIREA